MTIDEFRKLAHSTIDNASIHANTKTNAKVLLEVHISTSIKYGKETGDYFLAKSTMLKTTGLSFQEVKTVQDFLEFRHLVTDQGVSEKSKQQVKSYSLNLSLSGSALAPSSNNLSNSDLINTPSGVLDLRSGLENFLPIPLNKPLETVSNTPVSTPLRDRIFTCNAAPRRWFCEIRCRVFSKDELHLCKYSEVREWYVKQLESLENCPPYWCHGQGNDERQDKSSYRAAEAFRLKLIAKIQEFLAYNP